MEEVLKILADTTIESLLNYAAAKYLQLSLQRLRITELGLLEIIVKNTVAKSKPSKEFGDHLFSISRAISIINLLISHCAKIGNFFIRKRLVCVEHGSQMRFVKRLQTLSIVL